MLTQNMNVETGIHYGVIPKNDLFNFAEEFFDHAEDMSLKEGFENIIDTINSLKDQLSDTAIKDILEIAEQDFGENFEDECSLMRYERNGFIIEVPNDDCDLFIIKSPYFTHAPFCSPCAPGACYIKNGVKEGEEPKGAKAYCLPEDWFEKGKCPYKYWEVKENVPEK